MTIKLATNSILYILIIISGIWMARIGKPYNPVAFNLHKFIALGFIVYTIVISKNLIKSVEMSPTCWALLILAGFFVLLILVSGGIISSKEAVMQPLVLMHKLSSGLALVSIITWFYLMLK